MPRPARPRARPRAAAGPSARRGAGREERRCRGHRRSCGRGCGRGGLTMQARPAAEARSRWLRRPCPGPDRRPSASARAAPARSPRRRRSGPRHRTIPLQAAAGAGCIAATSIHITSQMWPSGILEAAAVHEAVILLRAGIDAAAGGARPSRPSRRPRRGCRRRCRSAPRWSASRRRSASGVNWRNLSCVSSIDVDGLGEHHAGGGVVAELRVLHGADGLVEGGGRAAGRRRAG